jgi:hypothetical protein
VGKPRCGRAKSGLTKELKHSRSNVQVPCQLTAECLSDEQDRTICALVWHFVTLILVSQKSYFVVEAKLPDFVLPTFSEYNIQLTFQHVDDKSRFHTASLYITCTDILWTFIAWLAWTPLDDPEGWQLHTPNHLTFPISHSPCSTLRVCQQDSMVLKPPYRRTSRWNVSNSNHNRRILPASWTMIGLSWRVTTTLHNLMGSCQTFQVLSLHLTTLALTLKSHNLFYQ